MSHHLTTTIVSPANLLKGAPLKVERRPQGVIRRLMDREFEQLGVDAVIACRYSPNLRQPWANHWKIYTSNKPGDMIKYMRTLDINKFQQFAIVGFSHGPNYADGHFYPRVSNDYLSLMEIRAGMAYKLLHEQDQCVVDNGLRSKYFTLLRRVYERRMTSDQEAKVEKRTREKSIKDLLNLNPD